MSAPPYLWVNGVDLGTKGLWVSPGRGSRSAPTRRDNGTPILGGAGRSISTPEGMLESRRITYTAMLIGDQSAVDPELAARTQWEEIKAIIASGPVELIEADRPDRGIDAIYQEADYDQTGVPPSGAAITLTFDAPNPYWHAIEPDYYTLLSGAAPVPIRPGSAASTPHFTIVVANNPTITLRNAHGAIVRQMDFAIQLLTNQTLMIDETWDVILIDALGVATRAANAGPVSGSFLTLNPIDAIGDQWPTLETSSGVVVVTLRRQFL